MARAKDSPKTKVCDTCKVEKSVRSYRGFTNTCTLCTRNAIMTNGLSPEVALAAERRRQQRILDKEIKNIAAKKVKKWEANAENTNRKRRLAKLVPEIKEEAQELDPATIELARREIARRKLIEFVKQFHPRYKAGWVHHDICRRLEKFSQDVADGKSPRLMLLMPPRHGKSQLASKLYPAWHLGHHPEHEFIGCSYNISLALDFSREIRDVIKSERYPAIFPKTELNPDFQSAEAWRLKTSTGVGAGGYNAAGIGGGITGKGAHILVIDDPVKNAEEAENADTREKIFSWYQSAAYTRLAPGGGVLIIQTCWHDDDLAGKLQKTMKEDPEADQFEVVKYPAIAEVDEEYRSAGEALHPDRYNLEALLKIKRTLGNRHWSALYQQDPISEEGAYFREDMFKPRGETIPIESMYIYQAWDFAISEKKENDWTVGVSIGIDFDDTAHVLELRRFKTNDSAKIIEEIIDMYAKYNNVHGFGVEDGQIWKTMKSALQKRMKERHVYLPLEDKENILQPLTDKLVRARPLQSRMSIGKVTFPHTAEWFEVLKKEFVRFPAAAHDDCVDALAWAVRLTMGKSPPRRPTPPKRLSELTVAEKLARFAKTGGGSSVSHMAA